MEIQYHIERNEKTVEDIKEHNGISGAIDYLVNDAENVAQYYESHKHWTFAGHYLGAQRFGNRHRPRNRKTQQEQDFPDACKIQIHWNQLFNGTNIVRIFQSSSPQNKLFSMVFHEIFLP